MEEKDFRDIEEILTEVKELKKKVENMEIFLKSFMELALLRNSLEKEIVSKVKTSEDAFKNFMKFVERNRRDFLISILKKKILERCKDIK